MQAGTLTTSSADVLVEALRRDGIAVACFADVFGEELWRAALADAGLLRATRSGRETRYEVTPEPLQDAVAWMVDVGSRWDDRLARLGDSLARAKGAR